MQFAGHLRENLLGDDETSDFERTIQEKYDACRSRFLVYSAVGQQVYGDYVCIAWLLHKFKRVLHQEDQTQYIQDWSVGSCEVLT